MDIWEGNFFFFTKHHLCVDLQAYFLLQASSSKFQLETKIEEQVFIPAVPIRKDGEQAKGILILDCWDIWPIGL